MLVGHIKMIQVLKPNNSHVIETLKCTVIVQLRPRFMKPYDPLSKQSAVTVSILLESRNKNLAIVDDAELKKCFRHSFWTPLKLKGKQQ